MSEEISEEDYEDQMRRIIPQSNLDLDMMTTDAVWGTAQINMDLKRKLEKHFAVAQKVIDPVTGKEKTIQAVSKEGLWGLLGFYTRDMRLANLSSNIWDNEMEYVEYHLNLANDLLQEDMIESFLIALSRVASKLELSQSKGGFLRHQMNTFKQETQHTELEPPKKSLFGVSKKT